ncbi:3-deoxy-D-manno-octulosonic-acid transferase [Pseudooceanicola antarcticus]|uniref:3-deoxy-D-manno-octulosonic acid transferase n=1 Tax=Pseudooceanicola antarcticus TaxID=1247613 RepID=A0A285HS28_9RHOB|nr:3-deoxy-D-manno-octulosonic acid transferase [Pseudooceanicola antarcticus]SNY37541.1 3-deoxy-D-manno-octulosonic-acid transferase [Pseudooceanicola antarcticus]
MGPTGRIAHKALTRRGARGGEDLPPRPEGPLVWIHCPRAGRRKPAEELARRLLQMDHGVSVLLTLGEPDRLPPIDDPSLITLPAPGDETSVLQSFFAHWRPALLVWLSGDLRPALLAQARRAGCRMLLAEAEEDGFTAPRFSLRPNQTRRMLERFDALCASTANAARRLQRLGADPAKIEITGPLQEAGAALPCNEDLRDELAGELAGRPIWLSAMVHREELAAVLDAHRRASRLAHRLLLLLVPDDPEEAGAFREVLDEEGWRYLSWSEGDMPREETQVLLADTRGDMGLWYRLSPVTFMAGSLMRGMKGHDPFEPATLGSAVLYGPFVAHHLPAYSRLAQAGAARLIRDSDSLAQGLSRILAPDQAATMATAAWDVATEGAEMTDRVFAWVAEALDESLEGAS